MAKTFLIIGFKSYPAAHGTDSSELISCFDTKDLKTARIHYRSVIADNAHKFVSFSLYEKKNSDLA